MSNFNGTSHINDKSIKLISEADFFTQTLLSAYIPYASQVRTSLLPSPQDNFFIITILSTQIQISPLGSQ